MDGSPQISHGVSENDASAGLPGDPKRLLGRRVSALRKIGLPPGFAGRPDLCRSCVSPLSYLGTCRPFASEHAEGFRSKLPLTLRIKMCTVSTGHDSIASLACDDAALKSMFKVSHC